MSLIPPEYERAIQGFARDMGRLGDAMVSVYVYGSAARGTVRPGKSDLDFDVYLRHEALEDREAFIRAAEVMIGASRNVTSCGVPYDHPCAYWGDDELRYVAPAFLSDKDTRLVAGSDIRERLTESVGIEENVLHEFRHYMYPLAQLLAPGELTPQERAAAVGGIEFTRKHVPQYACAEAGEPSAWEDAPRTLARICPDVDLSVLEEAAALRATGDELPGSEALKGLLRRCLALIEDLDQRIAKGAGR